MSDTAEPKSNLAELAAREAQIIPEPIDAEDEPAPGWTDAQWREWALALKSSGGMFSRKFIGFLVSLAVVAGLAWPLKENQGALSILAGFVSALYLTFAGFNVKDKAGLAMLAQASGEVAARFVGKGKPDAQAKE
jgi:hypothetical protein